MIRIGHGFDVHKSAGQGPITIEGRSDNLKVTREEDLTLAELYLS